MLCRLYYYGKSKAHKIILKTVEKYFKYTYIHGNIAHHFMSQDFPMVNYILAYVGKSEFFL